ncbi:MAG: hypothetical protein KBC22_02890 [Candidatus Pacebacteria bacterium]|nr:hypothetical protein [Candidatus Paceibacterota bacterium]
MATPLKSSSTDVQQFCKDHPDISEADIESAINPSADEKFHRRKRQSVFVVETQKILEDRHLKALFKANYNKTKKDCRTCLQRLQQKWKEGKLKQVDYKKALEVLLLRTPMHSTIRTLVIRELLKMFYQQPVNA